MTEEERKERWLAELAEFIVEANMNTWAADGAEVEPERPGYKELEYSRGPWRLRDSYTGYFAAPGMTTVYYKEKPAWTMAYGGDGMMPGYEKLARKTYIHLRKALMRVTPDLPYRGPKHFEDGEFVYLFQMSPDQRLTNFFWQEGIWKRRVLVFSQMGFGGLVIGKDENKEPVYPWNL